MIHLDQVVATYGSVTAVDGLTMHVPEGSFFGFLGPNGAGKSTALATVFGQHTPASGTVRVAGLDPVTQRREVLELIGVVPQRIALYRQLSVLENLRIFGGLHGLTGTGLADRVEWGLDVSQLSAHQAKPVDQLSGGMQRRLNVAVGLLHAPKVAICDEPTAGVDSQSRNHIFKMLRDLHAAGTTVVYTTHYLEEVEALCDLVAIIDHGRLLKAGPLSELLDDAETTRVTLREPTDRVRVVAALAAMNIPVKDTRGRTLEELVLALTGAEVRD